MAWLVTFSAGVVELVGVDEGTGATAVAAGDADGANAGIEAGGCV